MAPTPEAWHEAGHALAAHLCGGTVREVTLESELDGHGGHVAVEWGPAGPAESARRSLTVALAGPVAELVFAGDEALEDPHAPSTWRADWAEAEAQLALLSPDPEERAATRERAVVELRSSFESADGYERLARIADALDAHETLDETLFVDALGAD
ncbi:MAG: hypothetical protein AAGB93_12230 [Planctomycetota bacterium]